MSKPGSPSPKGRNVTIVLAVLTVFVLALSVPGSLQYAREHGDFYLFSRAFFEDIPKRLTGPGKFRFVLQPVIAIILGIRSGRGDARSGLPPYLYAILFKRDARREMMRSAFLTIVNLLLMGILIDSVCQWLILGISYPGAALVVGPVLIVTPYTISRALTNRLVRTRKSD
jgi:hypothetical protein